jgi:hypothetical protein
MGLVFFRHGNVCVWFTDFVQGIKCPIVWGWSLEPLDETGWPVLKSEIPSSQPWNPFGFCTTFYQVWFRVLPYVSTFYSPSYESVLDCWM